MCELKFGCWFLLFSPTDIPTKKTARSLSFPDSGHQRKIQTEEKKRKSTEGVAKERGEGGGVVVTEQAVWQGNTASEMTDKLSCHNFSIASTPFWK